MAGKGFSGKSGTVNIMAGDPAVATEVCEVTKWSLDPTVAVSKYNSNKTGGHKKGVSGVRDTKGVIEIKIDGDDGVQLQPGDAVALELHLDDSGDNYYEIAEAIISGSPVECDIDGGEVVGMTFNFEASDCTPHGLVA